MRRAAPGNEHPTRVLLGETGRPSVCAHSLLTRRPVALLCVGPVQDLRMQGHAAQTRPRCPGGTVLRTWDTGRAAKVSLGR